MPTNPLPQLRALCLALPEATEKSAWGAPTFRIRDKPFAIYADNYFKHPGIAVHCKAEPGVQEMLIHTDATRFFVPPFTGPRGWIGVRLDVPSVGAFANNGEAWDELADLLEDGYRLIAPKRLIAILDSPPNSRA